MSNLIFNFLCIQTPQIPVNDTQKSDAHLEDKKSRLFEPLNHQLSQSPKNYLYYASKVTLKKK